MNKKKGYMLLITVGISALLLVLAISYVGFYGSAKGIDQNSEQTQIARAAAGSGIQDGLYQLKRNQAWNTGFSNVSLPHSGASYSMTFTPGSTPYSTNNIAGSVPVTGYNGRIVPASSVHLVSRGFYNGVARTEEAMLWWHSIFMNGVATDQTITISGNTMVDSYNSLNGNYNKTHQNTGGNIRTNSGGNGTVTLNGGATVDGTITVGPGGDSSSIVTKGGSTYIQPGVISSTTVAMPFLTPPSIQSRGELTSSVTLSAGTYVYDEIDLSGQSFIQVTGPVTLYVLGNIDITGNPRINDISANATWLSIIGGPQTTSVSINGLGSSSSGAYFTVYAPAANVSINGNKNSALYGSIIAKSFNISGGTAIHYDQALAQSPLKVFNYQSQWK